MAATLTTVFQGTTKTGKGATGNKKAPAEAGAAMNQWALLDSNQ
jgi:hypothetical protein